VICSENVDSETTVPTPTTEVAMLIYTACTQLNGWPAVIFECVHAIEQAPLCMSARNITAIAIVISLELIMLIEIITVSLYVFLFARKVSIYKVRFSCNDLGRSGPK